MKTTLLSGIVLFCATAASAQTRGAQPPSSSGAPQTVTMTGCVGSVAGAKGGFMLSNPLVVPPGGAPATAQAGTPASTPQPTATQPNAGASPGTSGVGANPPSSTGTAGAVPPGATGTAGAAGSAAAGSPTSAGAGTPGSPTPAAPGSIAAGAGTTGAMNGYRLSGTDMSSWSGQRVQIVGIVVPGPTSAAAAAPTGATNAGAAAPMPEFRVQSVQPVDGPCPK